MTRPDIESIRNDVAYGSVGASTLRNIGAAGDVASARKSLATIELSAYQQVDLAGFIKQIDTDTEKIRQAFPNGAKHFGAARKVLNTFLRGAYYNTFLCSSYGLDRIASYYEIPLDKLSALGILSQMPKQDRVPWVGVKHVTPSINATFQRLATELADRLGTLRVHLDAVFWGGRAFTE